jgi:choline dehydrogenase-like flavoprotein
VTGVVYFDKDRKEQRQQARVVCVAGNSIETPRLLLLSASNKFPDGLANSSGQVGQLPAPHHGLGLCHVRAAGAHVPRHDHGQYRLDEAHNNPKRGFVGGYELERCRGLPFMAAFLDPGAWGPQFTEAMDNYVNMAGLWIVGEDMPQESNRVTLHASEKDQWGLPVPNVHYDDHPNDLAMRNHAYKQSKALYEAVGAKKVYNVPPYPSTHNLGTCRMSAKAKDGVCNKWGQTHDMANLFISDGSQYTTGAAENPTLTIVTLAIRQAEYIAKQMSARTI